MLGSVSSKMKELCDNIIRSHQERQDKLKLLREQSELVRLQARRFLEDFKKKEKEVKADLEEASRIWREMNETLEKKRQKSNIKGV